jgi:selenocysteine lyase/cysteine desulfurase
MATRRSFIASSAGLAGGLAAAPLASALGTDFERKLNEVESVAPSVLATDEEFWQFIRQAFTISPNLINLNNGGVSPQPKVVQDKVTHYQSVSNEGPAHYMWAVLGEEREPMRRKLAQTAGCSPENLAVLRNTTEALDQIIFGFPLVKGEEVVLSKYDYPNVINAWKQREMRDGIVLKWIDLPMPVENDDLIVKNYSDAFTSKTRLVNVTHMINWTGQILPVKKITRAAHAKNIDVMVDGAHTFAHLDFKVPDLECDYFGCSLHKWLFAPFGTGFLYVKEDKISKIWPLMAAPDPKSSDIRKFENIGTRPFATELAISTAIDFYNMIGPARKESRLRYLKDYWLNALKGEPGVKLFVSTKPEYSCGLGNFGIEGKKPGDLSTWLMSKHKILTTAIEWEKVSGIRVTPSVYTTLAELDTFIGAVKDYLKL